MSVKKHRLLAALLALISLLLCGYHNPQEDFTTKPPYLSSATYFSDVWPMNFWSGEGVNMDAEMEQIAADGFNSLILLIPWREFQPRTNPVSYNNYAWKRLDEVMEAARRHGLWVTFRVGYVWDYYDVSSSLYRFEELLYKQEAMDAWKAYVEKLYQTASAHPNFYGGFLTWEDCWGLLDIASSQGSGSNGAQYAKKIGFQQFVRERYTLQEVKRYYNNEISSYDQVYAPGRNLPAYKLMLEYYDDFLIRLLSVSQSVFPDMSLEVRLDMDPVPALSGGMEGFTHDTTYSCLESSYTSVMYSVSMGQNNEGELITAENAVGVADEILGGLQAKNGGKRLYVEQFLYMDATPEFSHNAQLIESEKPVFIRSMAPVLKARSLGYGVWTYRNYVDNMIYNPQFGLGVTGWRFTGNCKVRERENGNKQAYLDGAGGTISPKITHLLSAYAGKDIYVNLVAESQEPAVLRVSLDNVVKTVNVHGVTEVKLKFPSNGGGNLVISSDREMFVDDVKAYTYMQDGQLYDTEGNPLSCIEAIRDLNAQLR